MSAASEKGSEISDLLRKTGHPLLEVRSRSLRSVVFKLSNGLISCGQLVNEKEFLAHLLEWFNYDEWVLESQVLTLIGQLAQHEPAARTLVDIGGVEFLSQLRQNCDSSLHSLIDGILEHLLRVPSSSSSATVSSELLQSSFTTEMTTDMGSYTSQHLTALDTTGSTHHSVQRFSVAANDLQSLEVDLTEEVDQRPHTGDSAHIPSTHLNMGSHRGQSAGGEDAAELLMSADLHGVGIQFPYGESGVGVDSRLISGELEETNNNPCEGCLFPWLRLTLKDCHVLATTSSRLQSSKPDTLLRSSQFVHDILFEDFPPELFLQRPAVLKGLLQLSARGVTSSPVAASHFALLSLLKLTRKLRTRLNEMRDTPMKLMDRLAVSTEGEVEVDASLGSCDIPSQSHDHLESLTEEILDHLQSEQVSLDQYCHTLITSVAPLLPGYLNKHLTWTASHGDSDATPPPWSMAGGIAVCGQIMSAVMELMKTKTWRANCSTPPNEASLMCQSIDSICSSLNQCLSKWRRLAASSTRDVTPLLQLVCCATLHLSHCLSQLVQDLGLCDKSDYPPWRSCSSLSGVVQELMMNSAIGTTLPHLQDTLLPLFQQLDPANARLYCKVMDMADCFHKMARFLKMAQSSQSELSAATSERIGQVLESLPGLWFTCNSDFISKAVNVSFDVLRNCSAESAEWSTAKQLLLSLLGHGSEPVMEEAYSHFVSLVLEGLSTSDSQPDVPLTSISHLLLDADILAELCSCGTASDSTTIARLSRKLLTRVLSLCAEGSGLGHLLQWMPYIEVAAGEDRELFEGLQAVCCSGDEGVGLTNESVMQCLLRLLYSNNIELRVWSFSQLTKVLLDRYHGDSGGEDAPPLALPVQSSLPLHDLLATATTSTSGRGLVNRNKSFQLEDVLKLRHILRSSTMDFALKKAALEQAALLLQDHSLHGQLVEEGFSEDILTLLQPLLHMVSSSPASGGDTAAMASPCVRCLYLLATTCDKLRLELSNSSEFLLGLFKVGLDHHSDKDLIHHITELLVLLLFNECNDGDKIKMPSGIAKRLQLPIPVETYVPDCGYSTTPILDPDLLTSDPIVSMLRTHYHVALAGSVSALVLARDSSEDVPSYADDKLHMQTHEMKSLKCMLLLVPFDHLVSLISHQEVIKGVNLANVIALSCLVTTDSVQFGNWTLVMERFLLVQPRTTNDVELLTAVLQFITTLLTVSTSPAATATGAGSLVEPQQLIRLVEVTCHEGAVCVQLLHSSLDSNKQTTTPQRTLLKVLIQFYVTITDVVFSFCLLATREMKGIQLSCLCGALCRCMEVAGSPDYYDLALLELVLKCVVNISSSVHLLTLIANNTALILSLMVSLRKVLWSFVSGRGGMVVASFMGKGIISHALLATKHLVQNSCKFSVPQGWWSKWTTDSSSNILTCLRSLLMDRDPKVRTSGYNLTALLCGNPEVVEAMVTHWTSMDSFGLWGVCLRAAMDPHECVLVRQQAFFVLVNLSAVCSRERRWSDLMLFKSDELSLNSGRALELLLESQKLFSLLLSVIKTQHLAKLKMKLYNAESARSKRLDTPTSVGAIDQCTSDSIQPQGGTTSQPLGGTNPHPLGGTASQPLGGTTCTSPDEQLEDLSVLTTACVRCCNPYVVSGWCQLVTNLLQAFPDLLSSYVHNYCVVASLTSILDPSITKQLLQGATQRSIHCVWWVRMNAGAVDLLKTLILMKSESSLSLLTQKEMVLALCELLNAHEWCGRHSTVGADCLRLCSSILSFLRALINTSTSSSSLSLVFSGLLMNWTCFVGLILHGFEVDPYLKSLMNWDLRESGLALLNTMLVHCFQPGDRLTSTDSESKQHQNRKISDKTVLSRLSNLLDSEVRDDSVSKKPSSPAGSLLCGALLKAYEGAASSLLSERWLIGKSLSLLLACSVSAKQTGLKDGLLELLMEELKTLHSKLCVESLEEPAHHPRRSKDSPTVDKLVSVVTLLRNFQRSSLEIKLACMKSGLVVVVHNMWPTCTVNSRVLVSVLRMLSCFTAKNPAGQASLAVCVKGSNSSLLQCVLKTATHTLTSHNSCTSAKLISPHSELLYTIFSLLANCCLSQECRAVLKKTGFLSAFTSLNPKSERALPGGAEVRGSTLKLSHLWIKLLVNLSFSSDGQQMIIKQPDSIDVLLDVHSSNRDAQQNCLLVLRNLCFHGPAKTLLASNENFLAIMSSALDNWAWNKNEVSLAASALWALLHNCAKIRSSLKKAGFHDKLSSLKSQLQSVDKDIDFSETDLGIKARTYTSVLQALNIISLC